MPIHGAALHSETSFAIAQSSRVRQRKATSSPPGYVTSAPLSRFALSRRFVLFLFDRSGTIDSCSMKREPIRPAGIMQKHDTRHGNRARL